MTHYDGGAGLGGRCRSVPTSDVGVTSFVRVRVVECRSWVRRRAHADAVRPCLQTVIHCGDLFVRTRASGTGGGAVRPNTLY